MSMSKRDFEMIADALRRTKPPSSHDEQVLVQWGDDVLAIASVLRISNPRFDRARFLKACGYGEDGK